MTRPILALRPDHVCPDCWLAWRTVKPRAAAIHCPHARVVARRARGSWQTERATADLLERLRAQGAL